MSIDERHMHNAPDVKHPPRGEGLHIGKSYPGCGHSKSTLGSKGVGPKWRCRGCVAAKAARGVSA